MTKNEFFEIAKKNIHFNNWKERTEFYEFYNDLILEMMENGKTEEEAIASFNINEIIKQYNSNINIDYEYETKLNLYKRDLKIYILSILIGLALPIIVFLIFMLPIIIKYKTIDFRDHSVQSLAVISVFFFFFAYIRINEVYNDIKIIKNRKKDNKKINVYIISFIVILFLLDSLIEWLTLYLLIADKKLLLLLVTFAVIIPFIIYFIIRVVKIRNSKK